MDHFPLSIFLTTSTTSSRTRVYILRAIYEFTRMLLLLYSAIIGLLPYLAFQAATAAIPNLLIISILTLQRYTLTRIQRKFPPSTKFKYQYRKAVSLQSRLLIFEVV